MYNAVTVIGKYSGELAFYGAGAGKLPTAAAVVADIINSRRHNGFMGYYWTSEKLKLIDFDDIPENYFIRAASNEKLIRKIFDDNVVIFASDYYKDQLAFLTVGITGRDLKYKLSELEKSVKVYSKFLFQN
jgi:homoserine dehydrogenase